MCGVNGEIKNLAIMFGSYKIHKQLAHSKCMAEDVDDCLLCDTINGQDEMIIVRK